MPTLAESETVRAFYEKDGKHVAVNFTFLAPVYYPADEIVNVPEVMSAEGLSPELIAASIRSWGECFAQVEEVSIAPIRKDYWIVIQLSETSKEYDVALRRPLDAIRRLFDPFFTDVCFHAPDSPDDGLPDLPGSWCVYSRGEN